MIDHVTVPVKDYETSKRFYSACLAPLGLSIVREFAGHAAGYGKDGRPFFWIAQEEGAKHSMHVALRADSRAVVDAFHAAALVAGGKDNGKPGPRPHYHPNYYGAFVFDPDGHNFEAVCHKPPAP